MPSAFAPVCAEDDIDPDYAYSKMCQCGGSEPAYWMACAWEPGRMVRVQQLRRRAPAARHRVQARRRRG